MPDQKTGLADPGREHEGQIAASVDEGCETIESIGSIVIDNQQLFDGVPAIQAVIFDLDGTLLDTLADLAHAGNQVLLAHDLPAAPIEAYKKFVGAGARNLMQRAFAASGRSLDVADPWLDHLAGEFGQVYDTCWSIQTKPYPGIQTLLKDLSDLGVDLMILSNKPDVFTRKITGHYFADIPFLAVCGKQTDWPLKPDPSLALDLCSRSGIAAGRTVFVGDSGSDMQTGRNGNFLPLGVLWGFRSADELIQNGAAHLFHEPAQLGEWLVRHADKKRIRSIHFLN